VRNDLAAGEDVVLEYIVFEGKPPVEGVLAAPGYKTDSASLLRRVSFAVHPGHAVPSWL
jgi:hypothetical protein